MRRLFGLIGFPLGHSFSASFFYQKFNKDGIEARYENFPLQKIGEFEALVKSQPDLKGLNVTVPHKQAIIPYLDALSKTARAVQAVNTICFCRKSGRLSLTGHNTDVPGFERSLKEHLKDHHTSALVLGTGGSSKAVHFVLDELGISYQRVSRKRGEGKITYHDLDHAMVRQNPLIINTTPLGMHPNEETCPDIPFQGVTSDHLLFDLVYNPTKTKFLAKGEEQGATSINGYDMLVYQAEASWKIWNRSPEEILEP